MEKLVPQVNHNDFAVVGILGALLLIEAELETIRK